ncbi:alpha/beta hydrolase [Actinoallomurus purpureus]|uniref:alpha/beta fold hydrolase n=1 Tax=Actinoallomurus purpureus TaxID=478114 RepID=UPI0020937766|nr:alpha/beta hydrolase [Actinoallomurus purpureus]MCO6010817.1 alpha/beta hydrolase [Actinoallomurus purpureus]
MEELCVPLARGRLTLRGRRTTARGGLPTLCLHGWLDNCASFGPLFERMADVDLVAVDLPGHGLSDPLPAATYPYLDHVAHLLELAQVQGWERFNLIGHSLGGALSTLIAGIHPEKIARLVLIDAIGPLPASATDTPATVARYLNAYLGDHEQPVYRSPAQAAKSRVQLADMLLDTAERLIERDLREVPGGYSWRSDIRLKYPSIRTFSEEQILAFLRNISAPTLLMTAERTALTEDRYRARIESVPRLEHVTLPGGHHLHMENADAVAKVIRGFLDADEAA